MIVSSHKRAVRLGIILLLFLAMTLLVSTSSITGSVRAETVAYIVQADDLATAKTAVAAVGGTVTHELGIINAVGAQLTPIQKHKLANESSIKLFDNSAVDVATLTETVRDEFNAVNYGNNNGTLTWLDDWWEVGDDQQPSNGKVFIENGWLSLKNRNVSIERTADLATAVSASLSFVYQRNSFDNSSDYVSVEISADGGFTLGRAGSL